MKVNGTGRPAEERYWRGFSPRRGTVLAGLRAQRPDMREYICGVLPRAMT